MPDTPSREQLERMRRAGMHVIPTLYTVDSFTMRYQPGLLDARMVRLTVPAVERETARNPAAWMGTSRRSRCSSRPTSPSGTRAGGETCTSRKAECDPW